MDGVRPGQRHPEDMFSHDAAQCVAQQMMRTSINYKTMEHVVTDDLPKDKVYIIARYSDSNRR